MPSTIKGSVGKKGKNGPADVEIVQALLNGHSKNGGYRNLKVDGQVGKKTIAAIEAFQKNSMGFKKADGRVDPGKLTFKGLVKNTKKLEKEPPVDKDGQKAGAGGDSGGGAGKGKVTGKTTKVGTDIVKVLQSVADHYGTTIHITSGWRSPQGQAKAMWGGWNKHLKKKGKNGGLYRFLQKNEKLRAEIDEHFKKGDKSKFSALIVKNAGKLSLHLTGRAVDVSLKTAKPHIRAALKASGLRLLPETAKDKDTGEKIVKCWHFDNRNKISVPNDSVKAKWPAAK